MAATVTPEARERIRRNLVMAGYFAAPADWPADWKERHLADLERIRQEQQHVKSPQAPSSSDAPGGRVVTPEGV